MKRLYILMFIGSLIWMPFYMEAQEMVTIIGEVRSNDDSQPVPGASVQLLPIGLTTITDEQGHFLFDLEKTVTLSNTRILVSALGYSSHEKEIIKSLTSDSLFFKIELKALKTELQTVVITASKYQQKQEETTLSLSVLKPYLSENKNATDAERLLEQTPGVHLTDGQINIRSGSGWSYGAGSRVQVLLDGLPLVSPDAGQVQWSLLPLEAMGQFEILKGASSALFGTAALNGTIQLSTIQPGSTPKTHISLFHSFYNSTPRPELKWWGAEQNRLGVRFMHSEKKGNSSIVLSGLAQLDQGYKWKENDDKARLFAQWTRLSSKIKNLEFGISAGAVYSENGESLLWNGQDSAYIALNRSVNRNKGTDFFIDPKVKYRHGRNLHVLQGRFMRVENQSRNLTTVFDNSSVQSQLQYQNQQFFSNRSVLTMGLYGNWGASESVIFGGFHTSGNASAFAQYDFKWRNGSASLGGRWEYAEVNKLEYSQPVLRFGLNQALSQSTYVRGSFGQGFRFPSMAELYTSTNIGALYVYPNSELKPEKGYSAEMGLRQVVKNSKVNAYADVSAYLMHYDQMMEFSFAVWGSIPQNPLGLGFKSVNIGASRVSGVELEIGAEGKLGEIGIRVLGGANFSNPVILEPQQVFITDAQGNALTYEGTSSNSVNNRLKYRYTQLYRFDIEVDWKRFIFGSSTRGNNYMQNVDAIFENPQLNFILPGNGILEARQRLNRPDWIFDTRLFYRLNTYWQIGFLVENATNREVMSRPAKLEAPRRFTLSVRFEG